MLFRRRRTFVALLSLAVVPAVFAFCVSAVGPASAGGAVDDLFAATAFSPAVTALVVLAGAYLPLLVAVVAADSIAGEANLGTMSNLLIGPIGRGRLVAAKLAGILVFAVVAPLTVVVTGLLVGSAFFGFDDLVTPSGVTISAGEATLRAIAAALLVGMTLAGLGAVGLFVSTLTDQPSNALAATFGFFLISHTLDYMPQLGSADRFLVTHHWESFAGVLRDPMVLDALPQAAGVQAVWLAVLTLAAWARLRRSDALG